MSISSSVIVGKPNGLFVKASYPNFNQVLSLSPTSKYGLISKCKTQTSLKSSKRNSLVVHANIIPGADSLPAGSTMNWILGIAVPLGLALPYLTHKWGPLGALKERVDNVVQKLEDFVEGVEVVAGKFDKIAEGIRLDLPEGKLKDMIKAFEEMAEKTAKTAGTIDGIIDKAQEAEEKVVCIMGSAVTGSSKKETKEQDNDTQITLPKII